MGSGRRAGGRRGRRRRRDGRWGRRRIRRRCHRRRERMPPPPPGGNGGARGACPGGETTGGRERQHLQEHFRCFVELVLLPLIGVHLRCMQDPTDCDCGEGRLLHPPHTTYIIPYIIALAAAPSVFPRWHFEKFDGSQDIFLHPQNVQFRKPIPSWKKPVQAR